DCQKIGNYLFKTPLIKGLALEGYEVYILGSKLTKELGDNNPYIKEVIIDNCYRKKSFDIFRNIKTGLKYRNFFDFYIENVGSTYLREALLMRILNAKKNIGIERKNNKILKLLDIVVKKTNHMREDGIEILKYFKIQSPKCIYDIHLSKNKYENMIKKKPLILYNGLASTKSRSIDKDKESGILERLKTINWIDVQQIKKENSIIDLCGLIKKADLVITVDTGIAHIASAFNIPIIIHETNERVYPKSDIVIEENFYKKELPKTVEDILKYVYTISA
uniref:glycosyltransferase family 9 protein n=1 Tax=uncultured Cetobacterium sp. TaxID=527638 RepID=UPI0026286546